MDTIMAAQENVALARSLNDVLEGRLDPSPILDLSVSLDEVAAGYAAMDQRQAIKVMVRP